MQNTSKNPYHVRVFYDETIARWVGFIVAGPVDSPHETPHIGGYLMHASKSEVVDLARLALGADVECVDIGDPTQAVN